MTPAIHGLGARQGDPAFAFFVLRMVAPVTRAQLLQVVQRVAPLLPDVDQYVAALPAELDEPVKLVALPWAPPEAGHAVDSHRRLIDGAGAAGVDAAWFFQCGTRLVAAASDRDEDDDDNEPTVEPVERAATTDESWGDDDGAGGSAQPIVSGELGGDRTAAEEDEDDDDDDDDEDDDDDDDDDDEDKNEEGDERKRRFAMPSRVRSTTNSGSKRLRV